MSTYFISDLHLQPNTPKITTIFLNFLQHQAIQADAVYILGDLFETWIGDDDPSPFANTIKQALNKLTATGVPIYFMHGNRDFILGQQFANETGLTLLPDPSVITLYGNSILLTHGDLLCIDDLKYQAFRRKAHSEKFQTRLLRLPLWIRRLIAIWARYKSKKHTQTTDLCIQDVNQTEVEHYLQQHNVNLMIHGHTHRPAIHEFILANKLTKRIVLAAWHEQGYLLKIDSNGVITTSELTN